MKKSRLLYLVCSGIYALGLASTAVASIIADSEAEFSSTQGLDNWFYGQYTTELDSSTFQQLAYDAGAARWGNFFGGEPITFQTGGHPGFLGGLTSDAIRRWSSEVAGIINISGSLSRPDTTGGNGISGMILIDGVTVYQQDINFTDSSEFVFSIDSIVSIGSTVDFVVHEDNNDPFYDTTIFTAVISQVPIPGAVWLFGTGLLGLIGIARRKKSVQTPITA